LTDSKDKMERTLILCLTRERVLLYECDALFLSGAAQKCQKARNTNAILLISLSPWRPLP